MCTSIWKLSTCVVVPFFIGLMQLSNGQVVSFSRCPRVPPMQDFNVSMYTGHWYEIEKFWFVVEAASSCVSVIYFEENSDHTFPVEIKQIITITGKEMINLGMTRFASRDGSADFVLDVLITQSPMPFTVKYPYQVLDTDYKSYTIKWSCEQVGPLSFQNIWILTRRPNYYNSRVRKKVHNFLRSWGIPVNRLKRSNLSTCKELY